MTGTPVPADAIVRLATIGPDGPTGEFFDRDGTVPS